MYFLPRNNMVYSYLVHMPSRYRYYSTLLLTILILYGWFCLYEYIENYRLSYERSTIQLHNEARSSEYIPEKKQQLLRSNTILKKAIMDYCVHEESEPLQKTFTNILVLAARSGLLFKSCTIDKDQETELQQSQLATFNFIGTLEQAMQFFSQLKQEKIMVAYDRWHMRHIEHNLFSLSCCLSLITLKCVA